FKEYVAKTDDRIEELEQIKPKGNIKHSNKVKRQRRPPRRVKRNS
ncbi:tail fiber domain-containing protein, partial [Bacillus cereus]|nr:tail fiber domain-containing protein [Bacillus cereus]